MRTYVKFILIFSLLFCVNALAQTELSGTWEGKLAASPSDKITIQFVFTKQSNGSYKAILNSPDMGGIKNTAASAVKYVAGKLTVDVPSLSGSYSGTMAQGTITGVWKQPGSTLPLVLTPYKTPGVNTLKPLLGEWVGTLEVPGSKLAIIFRFEMAQVGKFAAFMDVPDQGRKGLLASDVKLENNQVSLKVPIAQIDYVGQLSGNSIRGTWKQPGGEYVLNLTKGKYQPPAIDIKVEDINRLLGKWVGKMKTSLDANADNLTIILRFEKTKEGKLVAFTDSPEQGGYGIALADVVLKGNQFSFRLPPTNGVYSGQLSGNSITGVYTVNGIKLDLTVIKGATVAPPVSQVDIPAEAMNKLLGRWNGNMGQVVLIFCFEKSAAGKNAVWLDIPVQNVKKMPVLKASMIEDKISLRIAGAEYSGKLNGNKIDGLFKQNGQTIPLLLTKE